jgi:hypothetical protein
MTRGDAPTSLQKDLGAAGQPRTLVSGRDYTRVTLLATAAEAASGSSAASTAGGERETHERVLTETPVAASVPGELDRLADPPALSTCLAAVVAAHGGTVSLVDYARFESQPALITVLAGTPRSGQLVVVVGPECGLHKDWTDERYVTHQ